MRLTCLILCLLLLCGCGKPPAVEPLPETAAAVTTPPATQPPETETPTTAPTEPDPLEVLLRSMSIEERVGQLFLARCDDSTALRDISELHLGGLILFGQDFEGETPDSLRETLSGYQDAARIPLLIAVDEEGGTVVRVSSQKTFREARFPSPRTAYADGGLPQVLKYEEEKCALLASLGINVNMGPVCDISTEPSAFMYRRSLGGDSEITGEFVHETVDIMASWGIGSVLKHFPGYGNNPDTHTGIARDSRSLEALDSRDLRPFAAGIAAGADAILVSHTIVEALDPELPASLSPAVHRFLRGTMYFDGVILTDDLVMEAIAGTYGAGEAAVLAVLAGNDLLCSTDYRVQYEAVLAAVMDGRISFNDLNDAVRRVLAWKAELGLI